MVKQFQWQSSSGTEWRFEFRIRSNSNGSFSQRSASLLVNSTGKTILSTETFICHTWMHSNLHSHGTFLSILEIAI